MLFNAILRPDAPTPQSWRQTVITVIPKAGDLSQPQNYRPICSIPSLYKLFSKLLYTRLQPQLDKQQPPDQAGFRPGRSTQDHLFTFHLLRERAREWNQPLWIAALDFKKAFDTVEHESLWAALASQGITADYIHILKRLYSEQTATVQTDTTSRPFHLLRGTKQGDPLSSLLFNSLLEYIMRPLVTKWQQRTQGVQLGFSPECCLTNLRFADDVLLVSRTLPRLTTMLKEMVTAAQTHGLQIHPDKTKILSTLSERTGRARQRKVTIDGLDIEILPYIGSVKYLGQRISFDDAVSTEVKNRLKAGWATFTSHRQELTGKHYPLKQRLRLFDGTVTPTILYAASTWTLTEPLRQQLQRTQRRMLRMVIGTPRRRHTDVRPTPSATGPQEPPSTPAPG